MSVTGDTDLERKKEEKKKREKGKEKKVVYQLILPGPVTNEAGDLRVLPWEQGEGEGR